MAAEVNHKAFYDKAAAARFQPKQAQGSVM
jgi:hypothetical protein